MKKQQIQNILTIFTVTVILLAVGIISTLIWKLSRGKQEKVYNPLFGNLPIPITVDLEINTIVNFNLENSIQNTTNHVYKINQKDDYYPSLILVNSVGKNLGLQKSVDEEDLLVFSNESNSQELIFDYKTRTITLTYYKDTTSTSMDLPNEKDVEIIAKAELEQIELWPFDKEPEVIYKYYSSSFYNYYQTSDKDLANLVSVVFRSTFNDVPVISSDIDSGEIEVFINPNKEITKVIYTYRPIDIDTFGTYPIKPINSSISSVHAKKAEFIFTFEETIATPINVTEVNISYRAEGTDQQYLQPVYLFEGKDHNDQLVTILVPAIEDNYLNY